MTNNIQLSEVEGEIAEFNHRHELDTEDQFRQLAEEFGELAEAINRQENVADEAADVIFVAWSIGLLDGNAMGDALARVVQENSLKNVEKDGNKVTKDGLE